METLHKGWLGQRLKTLAKRWTEEADKLPMIFEDGVPWGNPRAVPVEITIPVNLLGNGETKQSVNYYEFISTSCRWYAVYVANRLGKQAANDLLWRKAA